MNKEKSNRRKDKVFRIVGVFSTLVGLVLLAFFLADIFIEGVPRISWDFITGLPSRKPENSGIFAAIIGTLWIMVMTAIFAIPIGVAAGIYLEEYGKKNRLSNILEVNISNLAAVPSIIYGLLGLEIFVRTLKMGNSVLTGSLTLSLLVLPIIIVSTREALRAVPSSLRDASYALGATKWQTIKNQILPAASGGIMTGVILSLSRAIGETAPLIVIGALAFVPFIPSHPMDEFTVLPIQIFNWISRPQHGFIVNAAAAIIILLMITFIMNGVAIYFRNKWQRKIKW